MAKDGIEVLPAILMGILTETLCVGIFWVLCFKTLSVLMDTHKSVNIKNVMVTITTAQLFTVTTHWILNVTRLMKGFIYVNEPPLGSIIYFGTLSDPIFVVITSLFILQGLLALSFNAYRLYVIWDHTIWVCIVPIISLLMLLVCGIGVCVKFAHLQMPTDIYAPDLAPWIESTLGAAGLTNVYCTVMIVYHIWRSERDFINMGVPLIPADNVKYGLRVLIDSSIISFAVTVSLVISYALHSNFCFAGMFIEVPIIGIAYCLIVVRVQGRVDETIGQARNDFRGGRSPIVFRTEISGQVSYTTTPIDAVGSKRISTAHQREEPCPDPLDDIDLDDKFSLDDVEAGTAI